MPQPNPLSEPAQQPLPLFRPEVIAAQQHKFYGEILLIRPLSLTIFFWLAIGISAVVLGFLLLGSYTEKTQVSGILIPGEKTGLANLYVPVREIQFIHSGEIVPIRCQSCAGQQPQIKTGHVSEIPKSALGPEEVAAQLKTAVPEPMYKITLVFAQSGAPRWPTGARLEADLPLGQKPLLRWLFERDSADHAQN